MNITLAQLRQLLPKNPYVEHWHHALEQLLPEYSIDTPERIAAFIREFESDIPVGFLDITLHRDDLRMRPPKPLMPTQLPPGGIEAKNVVLVDDVLFSGRTIRAALDAIGELGRPKSVQLAVLVDRGHRQLPIRADFVGKNIPTALNEKVKVNLKEIDSEDSVELIK
jgi:pyrimidine operon attenuation protein/uracil phosphoribosyltransferase